MSTTMATTTDVPPPTEPRPPVDFTPPPVPKRTDAGLARITVALALIAAGVTVLVDRIGIVDAHLGHVLAASLTVVGAGLIVGAWFGRARSLILPGLLLVPLVILTSLFHTADLPVGAGFGERFYEPETVADIDEGGYSLAAGELVLDLQRLGAATEPVRVAAEIGAGQLDVRVPAGAEVRVTGRIGIGELTLFDRTVTGTGLDESLVRPGISGGQVIVLDLRVGAGQIDLYDGAAVPTDLDDQEFSR